jgi:hypothetical protein
MLPEPKITLLGFAVYSNESISGAPTDAFFVSEVFVRRLNDHINIFVVDVRLHPCSFMYDACAGRTELEHDIHLLEAPGRRGTRNAGFYGSLSGNCMKKLPNTAIAALQKVQAFSLRPIPFRMELA